MKIHEIAGKLTKEIVVNWLLAVQSDEHKQIAKIDKHPYYHVDPNKITIVGNRANIKGDLNVGFAHNYSEFTTWQHSVYGKRDYSKHDPTNKDDKVDWDSIITAPEWNEVTSTHDITVPDPDAGFDRGEYNPPCKFGTVSGQVYIYGANKFDYTKLPVKCGINMVFFECENVDVSEILKNTKIDDIIIAESTLAPHCLRNLIANPPKMKQLRIERIKGNNKQQDEILTDVVIQLVNGDIDPFDAQDKLADAGLTEYL